MRKQFLGWMLPFFLVLVSKKLECFSTSFSRAQKMPHLTAGSGDVWNYWEGRQMIYDPGMPLWRPLISVKRDYPLFGQIFEERDHYCSYPVIKCEAVKPTTLASTVPCAFRAIFSPCCVQIGHFVNNIRQQNTIPSRSKHHRGGRFGAIHYSFSVLCSLFDDNFLFTWFIRDVGFIIIQDMTGWNSLYSQISILFSLAVFIIEK